MKKLTNLIKNLSTVALVTVLAFGSFVHAASYPVGGQGYSLAGAGVTSSATTIPLTSFKTPDGRAIQMSNFGTIGYGTLEPQTTQKVEEITFTGVTQNANGSATLTGVTRGIDFIYPYTASSTLRNSHSGGSTFIISNTPNWYYDQFTMNNNNNLFTVPTASSSPTNKLYVDNLAFSGAGIINADTGNRGVVQIATGAQAAATTPLGSSGASLALSSAISTSTYSAATAANKIPVTGSNGFIDSGFLSFTGAATSTTTFATSTTFIGSFPAWQIGKQFQMFTSTGSSTFNVPSGITKVAAQVVGGGGGGGSVNAGPGATFGGAGGGCAFKIYDVSATSTVAVFVGSGGRGAIAGANAGSVGSSSSFGTVSATGGAGGNTGNGSAQSPSAGGVGSGGDINISGQGGVFGNVLTTSSYGGSSGGSCMGGGVTAPFANSGNAFGGNNGTNYGVGGTGSAFATSGSAQGGGDGAPGIVILRW